MTDTSASTEAPAVVFYVKDTLIADHFLLHKVSKDG